MGLVPTTIVPPSSRRLFIERAGLSAMLDTIGKSRITSISAPAGSGKTSAALYWFEQLKAAGRPGLWLAGRAGISDLTSFRIALKAAGVAAGLDWATLDPSGQNNEWFAIMAETATAHPVLVIDDAQLLPRDALDFITQMIASVRDTMTTILVSRGALGIPVARNRSLGLMVDIGASELRFDRAEAIELLSRTAGVPLDAEHMQLIIHDTHGWAAGLVMAGELYRREKAQGIGWTRLSDNLRAEFNAYFLEEVLSLQPQSVRDFLVDTAVLADLSPEACAAVSQDDDARRQLDDVYQAGLFLTAIDQERGRFRYHPLFRDSILGRLKERAPARAAALHRRASRHYAAVHRPLLSLDHAAASGDVSFVADQLEALANDLIYAGHLYRIDELGSDLPWPVLSERPMLLLALAWRRIRRLSFASAERLIRAAIAIRDARRAAGALDGHADETLDFMIRHRQIMLAAARDDMVAVEQQAEGLLQDLGDEHPYLSCTLLAQLMSARRELYHFNDILKLEAETRRALGRPGSDFASIALKSSVAPTLMAQGKTAFARRFLEEALATARANPEVGAGLAALPGLPLAGLLYEIGESGQAAELVAEYLPAARQWGFVDQIAAGYLVRARLAFAAGEMNAALSGLEEAHLVAIECGLSRLRALVVAEQVRILIRIGQIDEAEAAFRAGDFNADEEPVPTLHPTRQNESMAIAWLRIEMQHHRLVRVRKVAVRWLDFVKRTGSVRSVVTFELLLAEIAVLQGNRSKARRSVRAAVELAEPAGWTQLFIDEGEVIASLLTEAYANGPMLDAPADVFAAKLAGMMRSSPAISADDENEDEEDSVGLGSRLASREVDILTMVSGGLRNREIGERLGLTEGTVKWYMQQIYDKLGVRRRPQAVMRARQFGILA
ncbi:LuxR C-terminal-related transcriptional regulator [Sphingomonas solaris]|uniref:Helix-turn-helix transcriptional regulator n=1 Tax=Alterirhizorhabdus solaris TaxID=2529389 RepID=A0A558RCI9_9SPHN|nr:LuxR C-terminal-related transcriptional regulator [Sphingomonas solaris]TVV77159.1 helix-turn-helix transcriptional regulator [Sphingomonas solaris]